MPSFTLQLCLLNVRRAPKTCHRKEAAVVVLPYIACVTEDIMRVCGKYGMKVISKAGRSLRSVLTKVKDPLPMEKAKVV